MATKPTLNRIISRKYGIDDGVENNSDEIRFMLRRRVFEWVFEQPIGEVKSDVLKKNPEDLINYNGRVNGFGSIEVSNKGEIWTEKYTGDNGKVMVISFDPLFIPEYPIITTNGKPKKGRLTVMYQSPESSEEISKELEGLCKSQRMMVKSIVFDNPVTNLMNMWRGFIPGDVYDRMIRLSYHGISINSEKRRMQAEAIVKTGINFLLRSSLNENPKNSQDGRKMEEIVTAMFNDNQRFPMMDIFPKGDSIDYRRFYDYSGGSVREDILNTERVYSFILGPNNLDLTLRVRKFEHRSSAEAALKELHEGFKYVNHCIESREPKDGGVDIVLGSGY